MWHKTSNYESLRMIDLLLFAGIILIPVGGIAGKPLLFIVSGLLLLYYLLNKLYDASISKRIILKNEPKTIRLTQGDTGMLSFQFKNTSRFPFLNGRFQFDIGNSISIGENSSISKKDGAQHVLPLNLVSKEKTVLEVPILAKKRGITKIVNVDYHFPHLFMFYLVKLSYIPFYRTDFIVYPKPLIIKGLKNYFQTAPGEHRFSMSPFEDIENRIGTRDYQYSDPFHRINWKASVKSQQLQTNTYEKVLDASLAFIINLDAKESWHVAASSKETEKLLSYTAYLCQYAAEQKYPYELYINVRKPGKVPYVHVPEGAGNSYYMHCLETLARIHEHPITYSFEQMVYRIGQNLMRPKTIIIVGPLPVTAKNMIAEWNSVHHVVQVTETDGEAVLQPFRKGRFS